MKRHHQIEHVVVLMLENRSFDHMLGYLDRADLPQLDPSKHWNPVSRGSPKATVAVDRDATQHVQVDPDHSHAAAMLQLFPDGREKTAPSARNSGFVESYEAKAAQGRRSSLAIASAHSRSVPLEQLERVVLGRSLRGEAKELWPRS